MHGRGSYPRSAFRRFGRNWGSAPFRYRQARATSNPGAFFPIDALKIDQSFVRQITTASAETTIVTAVISMGRSLKLRVVAEGVETQEELEFLQAHQCDEAQGYYFSRPLAAPQFAQLLQTGIAETILH